MNLSRPRGARGFTLLEVLVAISILGILAVIEYRGLTGILEARDHVARSERAWRNLAMAFGRIEQGIGSAVDRPVTAADGALLPAFMGDPNAAPGQPQLEFTRMGYPGEAGLLSGPQRVGYRVEAGALEELSWSALDRAPGTGFQVSTLVTGLRAFGLRFLDPRGVWQSRWPAPAETAALPVAVELTLRLSSGAQITRLFLLP